MKTLTTELKRATGLAVKRKDTSIHSKSPSSPDKTTILMRFGDKFYTQVTKDVDLPTAREEAVNDLPGSMAVAP